MNGWGLESSEGFFVTGLAPGLKVKLSWDVNSSAYLKPMPHGEVIITAWWPQGSHTLLYGSSGLQDLVFQQIRQKLLSFYDLASEVT